MKIKLTPAMTAYRKVTPNEIIMLKCICESDYHDGRHPLGDPQWFENPFKNPATATGVCSSLTKKGYAHFQDVGTPDHCMEITKNGWDALCEAEPEFTKKWEQK